MEEGTTQGTADLCMKEIKLQSVVKLNERGNAGRMSCREMTLTVVSLHNGTNGRVARSFPLLWVTKVFASGLESWLNS